jgi:membrane-associated phospholipid phosphatase
MIMHRRHRLLACMLLSVTAMSVGATAEAADGVETAGDIFEIALPVVSAGVSSARGDFEGLGQFAKSAGLTLAVTHSLKFAIDAERPNGGGHSFPSGHASISFCSAEFLQRRYGWAWGAPAYAVACFVGYSRVEAEEHYVRDVLAGALIGVVSSYFFAHPIERVSLDVSASRGGSALAVRYSW